jgi:hypothetical protein
MAEPISVPILAGEVPVKQCIRVPFTFAAAALVVLALAACTTPEQMRDAVDERASWEQRAGAPVERFGFSVLHEWHPLERDWVMLRFNGGRQLAVQLRQPCIAHVREARRLSLVQSMPNSLNRIADRIRIDDWECIIEQMRPVEQGRQNNEIDGSLRHSDGGT